MKISRSSLAGILLVAAAPLFAQEPTSDPTQRIRRVEERLEQLQRENEALRAEIDALKRELGTPEAAVQDLTAVSVAETPQPEPPIEVVQNQPAPAAGKVLNPDISVVGNFVGKLGDANDFEDRSTASLEESEISFQAFVDPYAQAKFFLAVGPEGAEMEEGYVNFVTLPHDLTAKVGKLKANFGKVNLMHVHQFPWIDAPLVSQNFFGEEGLADSGVSVSKLLPNRFNVFVEATGEVYAGGAEGVFEAENRNDLFYLGHLKAYRDLTDETNIEVGTSYARGTLGGTNEFLGIDVTWRYKPLDRAIYRSFISRTEAIVNRREGSGENAFGVYTSADYQFARRWFAGIRLDSADHPDDPSRTDRGGSLTLTFWPSEFSQFRAQGRRIRYGGGPTVNELLFQVQFSIGAHGAHTF